ncbi:MAG: hypothetical protein ABR598_00920, partial [Candidatus Dormibacteria bacterium]
MTKKTAETSAYDEVILQMATDPEFAARVRDDPDGTLKDLGLTNKQVAELRAAAEDESPSSSGLAARQSKSALLFGGGGGSAHHDALSHLTGG